MTTEINWGSIADWVSGIASFSAVVTALYLSKEAQRIRLHGLCGHRKLFEQSRETRDLISIFVTNTGTRTTIIKSIGLRFGLLRKRYAFLKLQQDDLMDPIPRPLSDGEQAHWGIPLDAEQKWIDDLFLKDFARNWLDVETMVIQVHTTNGGTFSFRPEQPLRQMIHAKRKQRTRSGS
jgi:hypothetical protein